MRKFEESDKSSKTVASMIVHKNEDKNTKIQKNKKQSVKNNINDKLPETVSESNNKVIADDKPNEKLEKFVSKLSKSKKPVKEDTGMKKNGKKVKESRKWDNAATGDEAAALDYSSGNIDGSTDPAANSDKLSSEQADNLAKLRGRMEGNLNEVYVSSDESEEEEDDSDEQSRTNKNSGGLFSGLLRSVGVTNGSANLTEEQIAPYIEQLRDRLIAKNVAGEIATKLCESVTEKLVGAPLGRFERVSTRVKAGLEESCTRLLSSCRRVDVLRDALDAKANRRPYVIVFCGVNGVGKSTNLAKIAFWLTEKNLRVLIAACDTFRSGAVEQLRTHVKHLNYIHPPESEGGQPMVELYEKGYGRDAAGIAMSAINYAKDHMCDVVLVDTAGRMQDNEPLMRALSKLINVNDPDLVLFVGEALVGNEAVDQLTKFHQLLADFSHSDKPRGIDGIVLTKFDTIDDKVGAAISMAYISGQPIVFVGTGQTYADLRQLSVGSVVKALMK